jgi:hypothetical protein
MLPVLSGAVLGMKSANRVGIGTCVDVSVACRSAAIHDVGSGSSVDNAAGCHIIGRSSVGPGDVCAYVILVNIIATYIVVD